MPAYHDGNGDANGDATVMIRLRDGTWEKGIAQQDLEPRALRTVEIVASSAN